MNDGKHKDRIGADSRSAMKHGTQSVPGEGAPVDSVPRRQVVYSAETTAAYGNVIDVGMVGNAEDVLAALRHLAMMVHCDFTGELRAPHTHTVSGMENRSESRR